MEPDEIRNQLRELTLRMIHERLSDEERGKLGEEIKRLSPDPSYLNYVFWSEETIEAAIEKAMRYKPILL